MPCSTSCEWGLLTINLTLSAAGYWFSQKTHRHLVAAATAKNPKKENILNQPQCHHIKKRRKKIRKNVVKDKTNIIKSLKI